MPNGTCWLPSMKVRLPRGSWIFGRSRMRQSSRLREVSWLAPRSAGSSGAVGDAAVQVELEELVNGAAGAEFGLVAMEPMVQRPSLVLVADAEIEPAGATVAGGADLRVDHEVEGAERVPGLVGCQIL